jgi:hypothetical protein
VRDVGAACPLSVAEEKDAVEKFDKLWPVIRHPRCLNCHGAVDPFVAESKGGHPGGAVGTRGDSTRPEKCQECHSALPGWDVPLSIFLFTGKSARQVCMQFKATEADPVQFMSHITNDKGLVAFTETAFKGNRGLNTLGENLVEERTGRPFQLEPPPISHTEMIERSRRWANAVGERGWRATPDCGCGRKKQSWTGTVTGVWNLVLGEMGHGTETTNANVRFEIDTSYSPSPEVYWSSVSGEIQWSIEISGNCQARSTRTIPIGLGADENPMATLQENPDPSGSHYMVSIGPWRDEDQPQFTVRCPNSPPLPGIPWSMGIWWNHELPGMVSADGKSLKGSYSSTGPIGKVTWNWDLQLDK